MVDNDEDFTSPEVNTFTTENWFTVPAPGLSDENYFWRVRSKDGELLSLWSERRSFIIDTVPAPAPTLLSPDNNSTVMVDQPTFSWTAVTEPNVIYRLQIDNDQDFSSPIYDKTIPENWHAAENKLIENLSPYYWRVASVDNAGNENWSGWFKFYLRVPPASTVNPISIYWNATPITITATASDNDGVVENIELWYRWSQDNESWSPWYFFGLDNDGSNGWSWTFTFENGDGFYQFYSRARDERGNYEDAPPAADASCGYDVTPPTMPSLTSPENNSTVRESYGKPTFTWVASTDNYGAFIGSGVRYRLIVDNDSDFSSPVYVKVGITDNFHTLENSLPEDNYYWKVVAVDGAGNENSSYWFRFTLRVPPISSVNPIVPYWRTSEPISISATASDNDGTVVDVELWYRYSADNSSWSAWIFWDHDTSPPYTFSFYPPSGEGFYQFYSRARDERGNYEDAPPVADASCGYDVTPPGTPAPALPENNSSVVTRTPTLQWSPISDLSGVTYELILDNDSDFSSPVYVKVGIVENLHTLENSLELGQYWWRVRAWDGANHSSQWSGTFTFTVVRSWNAVETWSATLVTIGLAGWFQIESWSTMITAPASWSAIETWSVTLVAVSGWRAVESWTTTIFAPPTGWLTVESWQSTITAAIQWNSVETWICNISTLSNWQSIESWSTTITTIANWQPIESWQATVTTATAWQQVETWNVVISAVAIWQLAESWTATAMTSAIWQLTESWTGTVSTSALWQIAESWQAIMNAPAIWLVAESWTGTISTSARWHVVESWSATIATTARWQQVENWTSTITTAQEWLPTEIWTATINTPTIWTEVESWQASATTSATWSQVEEWQTSFATSAGWSSVETWTAT
ncbi:MAG: hypothetical protein QXH08_03560, partial [Candidatus Hadarchaeales archaeon]